MKIFDDEDTSQEGELQTIKRALSAAHQLPVMMEWTCLLR